MLPAKEDTPIIAMESMNKTRFEDLEIINVKFSEWFERAVARFSGENEMMQERGFGPCFVHKSEHDNALALMDAAFASWKQTKNITAFKRYFAEALPQWLVQRVNSMGRVTALFLTDGISPRSVR